ncbi:MAG: putative toxin-antitoxin system toxin component, PIN family [Chloroflexi bacterium]|nr:putative toxin-antitoxin system toxin component, PIN family [Chloroflexota bacterium]
MTTAVLDTNVLASGFASHTAASVPAQVLDAWRGRLFTLAVSEHILTELARTFADPWFRRRLDATQVAADLALLRRQAMVAPITVEVHGVATHPEDDLVLATALSAQAEYLVTGDTKLQRLGSHRGVSILSPRAFLELITRGQRHS